MQNDELFNVSNGNSANFLDIAMNIINVDSNVDNSGNNVNKYIIDTNIYTKPNTVKTFIKPNSSCNIHIKKATIYTELLRIIKLSNNINTYRKNKRQYMNKLRNNGYSNYFLRKKIKHPSYKTRNKILNNKYKNFNRFNSFYPIFFVKYFDSKWDNHVLLKQLFDKYIHSNNLLNDSRIIISCKNNKKINQLIK